MSRVCEVTGKKTAVGNNRSHSMRATKRKFYPNLFYKKIKDASSIASSSFSERLSML